MRNRTNVPDPIYTSDTGTTRTRKYIYRRVPDITSRNFEKNGGFPFIVLSSSKIKRNKTGSADMTKSDMDFMFTVRVYSRDSSDSSNGDPAGADQRDVITDSIRTFLDNPTHRKTLISYGMSNLNYNYDTDEDELDGKMVYLSEFDIIFENNLAKSG
jgi:hypothetical protein